jgi:hypothetical protein
MRFASRPAESRHLQVVGQENVCHRLKNDANVVRIRLVNELEKKKKKKKILTAQVSWW